MLNIRWRDVSCAFSHTFPYVFVSKSCASQVWRSKRFLWWNPLNHVQYRRALLTPRHWHHTTDTWKLLENPNVQGPHISLTTGKVVTHSWMWILVNADISRLSVLGMKRPEIVVMINLVHIDSTDKEWNINICITSWNAFAGWQMGYQYMSVHFMQLSILLIKAGQLWKWESVAEPDLPEE